MNHPPNVMPPELQVAHYIDQIVKLEKLNAELLAELKYTQQARANECDDFMKLRALNAEYYALSKKLFETARVTHPHNLLGIVAEFREVIAKAERLY